MLAAVITLCVLGSVLLIRQLGDPFCTGTVSCTDASAGWGADLPVYRSGTWQRFPGGDAMPVPDDARPTDAVVIGPADVWTADARFLKHWNGRTWRRMDLSLQGIHFTTIASDGHHGVWIGCDQPYLLHYAAGSWSEAPLPIGAGWIIRTIANVHGSTEMWALAEAPAPGTRRLLLHYTS